MVKLGDSLDGALISWANVLEGVKSNRRMLLALEEDIDLFAEDVDALTEIAADGENDDILGHILDECDDFLDLVDAKR